MFAPQVPSGGRLSLWRGRATLLICRGPPVGAEFPPLPGGKGSPRAPTTGRDVEAIDRDSLPEGPRDLGTEITRV